MPVGKPAEDGTIEPGSRHYGGGHGRAVPQALQWECVSCGTKVEAAANPVELGCPHCGAGAPGTAGTAGQQGKVAPAPATSELSPPVRRPAPSASARADRVPSVEGLTDSSTVYRLIAYTGPPAWLEETLRRSLVGRIRPGTGVITATIVDDVSSRQQDLLGMASRQPGVWLAKEDDAVVIERTRVGQPPADPFPYHAGPRVVIDPSVADAVEEYERLTAPVTGRGEDPDMPQTPSTVTPSPDQRQIAQTIHHLVGHIGAYTIANALQQFSTVVEDETMERDKYWSPTSCLGVATALLDLIPIDWQPIEPPEGEEMPAAPPPEPPPPPPAPTIRKR